MTREEVFAIIGGELDYAKKYDEERSRFPDSVADKDKPVEVWLLWMEEYMAKARAAATADYDKTAALAFLRSALSLGVNCAMHHGMPPRGRPRKKPQAARRTRSPRKPERELKSTMETGTSHGGAPLRQFSRR